MKLKTNDTSELQQHFRNIKEIIAGRGNYEGWNSVERVDALNKWVYELYRFQNAVEPYEKTRAETIYSLSDRVSHVIDEAESAIESLCKEPEDRTLADIFYTGAKSNNE